MFKEKLLKRQSGIITFGLTPPKQDNLTEKIAEIAERQKERIRCMDIDGLVIYDVQNETERTAAVRPFPYLPTIDGFTYGKEYLNDVDVPKIIYRCVGKYTPQMFEAWLTSDRSPENFTVLVGAASSKQPVALRLTDAYQMARSLNPNLVVGGVAIPERHFKQQDEHTRILQKQANGCKFFISQAVYNVEAAKNFLSDYYYDCQRQQIEMKPILFTLAPCGSTKTLEFMKWLGVSIPRWLENDLLHSTDILGQSIHLAKETFAELLDFACAKGIPIGCNIESISIRKVEIEVAVDLVGDIRKMIQKKK